LKILLYAPLFLKENIGCKSSRFKKILLPSLIERFDAKVIGELIATSYTDAFSIMLRYFFEFLKEPVFLIFSLNLIISM
jgi:hypothetical protein